MTERRKVAILDDYKAPCVMLKRVLSRSIRTVIVRNIIHSPVGQQTRALWLITGWCAIIRTRE